MADSDPADDVPPNQGDLRERLLDAAISHVPFDGWSQKTLSMSARDAGVDPDVARSLFPRGPVDMALAHHERGDRRMTARLRDAELGGYRFRDRIKLAVRWRIEVIEDKEVARRGATLFALPQHGAAGSRAIWGTADAIWEALGDRSNDLNWYTKRATLAGVYSSTFLYWLGDESPEHQATWDFLDRRVVEVMRIEDMKAAAQRSRVLRPFLAGPSWLAARIRAPMKGPPAGFPGFGGPAGGGAMEPDSDDTPRG